MELFSNSINSGAYDVRTGVPSGVGGNVGDGFSCWNNPRAINAYGADFCGNATGGAVVTTGPQQSILERSLSNGAVSFTNNLDGTIVIALSETTYDSCLAAMDGSCDTSSNNIFATWLFNATAPSIDVPDVVGQAQAVAEAGQ